VHENRNSELQRRLDPLTPKYQLQGSWHTVYDINYPETNGYVSFFIRLLHQTESFFNSVPSLSESFVVFGTSLAPDL
jgi:hypothetical protein